MNRFRASFILSPIITISLSCYSQGEPGFSRPVLSYERGGLFISYDILNGAQNETFTIGLRVTDPDGSKINPHTIYGDIGEGITGGTGKLIRWDLEADNLSRIPGMNVQLTGRNETVERGGGSGSGITMGGAMARSIVLPGWGLTVMNPGSKHWIKGVGTYGCLAGATAFYLSSESNYQKYNESYDPEERENLLRKSDNQTSFAVVLTGAAAAVWSTDLIWTIFSYLRQDRSSGRTIAGKFHMGTDLVPYSKTPLLTLSYHF